MRQVLSRQVLGKGMLTAAAASSLLSIATGAAYAHPGATSEVSHSPGVLSGNSVSVPVTFAPNVCGNSVDGAAALNPAMGNTCATTTGTDAGPGHDYARYLSPEHAEAFERYLDEHRGRHALPERRHEEASHPAPRPDGPRHAAPRQEEARPEQPRPEGPRHAAPRHDEPRDRGGYGGPEEEETEEDCDEHPEAAPPAHHTPPAHHAPPPPEPVDVHPAPAPPPAVHEVPVPLPAPEPVPAPAEEPPRTLPAPLPAPVPVGEEDPAAHPPHGSLPVEREHPAPAPLPAPEAGPPADQPPAAPAGDTPVHLTPAPAPAPAQPPAPAPERAPAPVSTAGPVLAETGAGRPGAAAALASALVLGGAILYRRSRIA
ncbi:chaplin [Streptomyces subrutilus]|uniref:chaplin n=1 Tax=Streptomyces subrutilus TaxID=36818 RepID=UPI002E14E860